MTYTEFYEADERMTRAASRRNAAAMDKHLAADDETLARFDAYWDAAYKTQEAQKAADAR